MFGEIGACRRFALRALFPAFFGDAQLVAHLAKHLVDLARRKRGNFWQILIERVNLLDLIHLLAYNLAVPDHEQHFGQHRIDIAGLAFDNCTHLLVYTSQ